MEGEKKLLQFLECVICTEIAINAFQCSQCACIFCQSCAQDYTDSRCPTCRQQGFKKTVSKTARKMVQSLRVPCAYCEIMMDFPSVEAHKSKCQKRDLECKSCKFKGVRHQFVVHAVQSHAQQIIDALVEPPKVKAKEEKPQSGDRIANVNNQAGRIARIGQTGKYYCSGKISCSCCNGFCGPTNGCNCIYCHKLDIAARRLPTGYLVNKSGRACRISCTTSMFYCGALVLAQSATCDGHCGPTNGPQCRDCAIAQNQSITILKQLMK